jgi:hypothetical protein
MNISDTGRGGLCNIGGGFFKMVGENLDFQSESCSIQAIPMGENKVVAH